MKNHKNKPIQKPLNGVTITRPHNPKPKPKKVETQVERWERCHK